MAIEHHSTLLFLVAIISQGIINAAMANSLEVDYNGQSPSNVVPQGQSITYSLLNRNVSGFSEESDGISTGMAIYVDGSRIDADSGQFTAIGCSIGPSFTWAWACGVLNNPGNTKAISFTWTSPDPGTSVVEFRGYCQEWPVPSGGTRFCSVNGGSWVSVVATVITHYIAPDPTASISTSDTLVAPGTEVTLTWSSTNADACTGSWTGSALGISGDTNVTVNSSTTYTLTCSNAVGFNDNSVMVQVLLPEKIFQDGFESKSGLGVSSH